jgi:hypothetical protein
MALGITQQRKLEQNTTQANCYTAWYMQQHIIVTSVNTYPSAQHATFKPRTQNLPLHNVKHADVICMMWQTDQTRSASPHLLTLFGFLPITAL